jgi:hypothetical protein
MNKKYRVLVKKPTEDTWNNVGKDYPTIEQAIACKEWLETAVKEYQYKVFLVEEVLTAVS